MVARIIYALIIVINNSGVKNRGRRRGEAPPGAARISVAGGATPPEAKPPAKPQNERPARVEGMSSVPGGATPSATPHANARMRHNRHQTSYEIMLILKK